MNRKRLGGFVVVGLWAAVGVIVVACGDDDAATPGVDAGTDGRTQPTSTSTSSPPDANASDVVTTGDTGSPDATPDATPNDRAIWGFRAYCGDAIDASCPTVDDCPTFDGGGIAAQDCPTPRSRCLSRANPEAGLADRVFACESVATPIWQTTRLCSFEPCDSVDAGSCPSFDGGVEGQQCATPRDRCKTNQRVFVCQPNGGLFQGFNGYCDAGMGTRACNEEVDACAPADGGLAGSTCDVELARCYGRGSDGNKIFVCAQR